MGQGIGVDHVGVHIHIQRKNRRGATRHFTHRDIEHENRCLEDVQPDDFFHEVAFSDHDIKPSHHQHGK